MSLRAATVLNRWYFESCHKSYELMRLYQFRTITCSISIGNGRRLYMSLFLSKSKDTFQIAPGRQSAASHKTLLRGIAWTAHELVDRFNDVVWVGTQISR